MNLDWMYKQLVFINLYCIMKILSQKLVEEEADLNSLVFLHAIFRHGARTQTTLMGNDVHDLSAILEHGLGELTLKGSNQIFQLGLWIRQRYHDFFSTKYNSFEIFVRSSDYNRTLMSAQIILAALFPPTPEEIFQKELKWRPIPVHTTSRTTDKIIFDASVCQETLDEEKRVFRNAEANLGADVKNFLQFLSEESGYDATNPLPLKELRYVFDPLYCKLENGMEIPEWANKTIREQIWALYDISSALSFSTEQLVRLKAGRIFAEIIDRMEAVLNKSADPRLKVHFYSGHDTTASFNVRPKIFPRFASLVLIELHKNKTTEGEEHWIRLFYKNESDKETLWEWPIRDCSHPCTIKKLKKAKEKFLYNLDEDCLLDSHVKFLIYEKIYIALILVLSLLSSTLIFYIALDQQRKKNAIGNHYQNLEREPGQDIRLLDDSQEEIEMN